jgi:LmbE family N-acetylglucosaminyl deacetylase
VKLFDDDPSLTWLFAMTHPDDEISIAAWIRRLTARGATVHLSWSHNTAVREREGRAAAAMLGVPEENLMFFGAPDRGVVDEIPRLVEAYRAYVDRIGPDRVCCGAFEQGHIDHDATNYIVNRVFAGPVLEIPFYHVYTSPVQTLNRFAGYSEEEILNLNAEEQRFKKNFSWQYPSQTIGSVLRWYEAWQAVRLRPVELAKTERMRLQTHKNFLEPNLPPDLKRKVLRTRTWRRWQKAMETLHSAEPATIPVPS